MTAPPLPRRERVRLEVEPWKPPLNSEAIAHAAERIRVVQPLDVILDDIGDVLTDQLLAPAEFGDHARRLRGGSTDWSALPPLPETRTNRSFASSASPTSCATAPGSCRPTSPSPSGAFGGWPMSRSPSWSVWERPAP